jgi:cobalt/nickel transport system permease protein
MHMADALLSPAIGGTMWAATAAATVYCARKVQNQLDDRKIPLMGVLGAFVFTAQMINFAIPGTGSSGHIGGGLLLAILLGPQAAFLTVASVLTVQSLFFADGGLLALGCNIFNLGFFPCFIAYPFIYKKIAGAQPTQGKLITGSILAAIFGLQLGAFGVVLETYFSGISALPFSSFILLMQPIHLGIGLVEGLATAGVISFIWKARPEIIDRALHEQPLGQVPMQNLLAIFLLAAGFTGGIFAWYASEHPDGLEWAIEKVTGSPELENQEQSIHQAFENVQEKTSLMPDYAFRQKTNSSEPTPDQAREATTIAGFLGGILVLGLGLLMGFLLKKHRSTA